MERARICPGRTNKGGIELTEYQLLYLFWKTDLKKKKKD